VHKCIGVHVHHLYQGNITFTTQSRTRYTQQLYYKRDEQDDMSCRKPESGGLTRFRRPAICIITKVTYGSQSATACSPLSSTEELTYVLSLVLYMIVLSFRKISYTNLAQPYALMGVHPGLQVHTMFRPLGPNNLTSQARLSSYSDYILDRRTST
jgi:hypothetical protein